MTIKRKINGVEMEIELDLEELYMAKEELQLNEFILEVKMNAKEMEVELTEEQVLEIAEAIFEKDKEMMYFNHFKNSEYAEDIMDMIEEIAKEEE